MKREDILKDILEYRITNQKVYNENLLLIQNPELKHIFTQLRDDETRAVAKLQQLIKRELNFSTGIIAKIFQTKAKY